jgi:hypothetical protein
MTTSETRLVTAEDKLSPAELLDEAARSIRRCVALTDDQMVPCSLSEQLPQCPCSTSLSQREVTAGSAPERVGLRGLVNTRPTANMPRCGK